MPTPYFNQYIGGDWKPAIKRRMIRSPYDGRDVGSVALSAAEDAQEAITAAHAAFADTRTLPSYKKHTILRAIHDGIAARRDEFAAGITDESGKTIRDARAEVDRALLVFSLSAEEARRAKGETMPLDLNAVSEGRVGITRRFPVGVVGAITPFNFPLNLVAHKVGPAFATGSPVVLKPAERTPLTALRLAEVVAESGWPKGGFSVLTPETPQEVGEMLAADERVQVLSFTGSDKVGWRLKEKANRKRVLLELGGNAAVIVHDDADVEYSVQRCVSGAFANAGQVCISVQRIYVHRSLWEPWTTQFLSGVRALKSGDPADENTDIGPMTTQAALDHAVRQIEEALREGATALLQGKQKPETTLLSPTVLTDTKASMAVCTEEMFAPVVLVEAYDDFDEALARVNNSRFGLQAGVFTRDISRVFHAFDVLEVGGIIANDVPQWRVDNMPYGGEKESGFGREGVRYAMEEMTSLRLLALKL